MLLSRILSVLFILIYPGLAFTQTNVGYLQGNIVNSDDGKPYNTVNIIIKHDGDFRGAVSTNPEGFYRFSRGIKSNTYEVSLGIKGMGNIVVGDVLIKENETVVLNIMVSEDFLFADSDPLPKLNTESYSFIKENDFYKAIEEPLSTFSIDVDAASYGIVKQFINSKSSLPPQYILRIEELINYFDYDYPQPTGEHPFSIHTEMSDCPWNSKTKLVHIGLQGLNIPRRDLTRNNLVFLIDVSGSMQYENKLPLVQESLRLLVNKLKRNDRIAIVVYAGSSGLVLPSTPLTQKKQILSKIDQLTAGGFTAGSAGIELAYETALNNFIPEGNNRIILTTDGDFNVGPSSNAELVALIREKRELGIYLTVLGFGTGNYQDDKMEQLSNHGNGNYYYISDRSDAIKFLVEGLSGTLYTIAKDVKIQVEFNPAKVQSYRLIGYENRDLENQDFSDDDIDAGELGPGHTVTAIYEIIPVLTAADFKNNGTLIYQIITLTEDTNASNEVMTVKVRYKEPKEIESKLIVKRVTDEYISWSNTTDSYKFSSAVAMFGMILNGSKYIAQGNLGKVIYVANNSKGKDKQGYRQEFIQLAREAGHIAGKSFK